MMTYKSSGSTDLQVPEANKIFFFLDKYKDTEIALFDWDNFLTPYTLKKNSPAIQARHLVNHVV